MCVPGTYTQNKPASIRTQDEKPQKKTPGQPLTPHHSRTSNFKPSRSLYSTVQLPPSVQTRIKHPITPFQPNFAAVDSFQKAGRRKRMERLKARPREQKCPEKTKLKKREGNVQQTSHTHTQPSHSPHHHHQQQHSILSLNQRVRQNPG